MRYIGKGQGTMKIRINTKEHLLKVSLSMESLKIKKEKEKFEWYTPKSYTFSSEFLDFYLSETGVTIKKEN